MKLTPEQKVSNVIALNRAAATIKPLGKINEVAQ
jgi:hypothetical protein